jgi:malonate decarboxylase beta subunit
MSGPEVIETAHGVEEFDSRDRGLVWRTTGAKHRYLLGDVDVLVKDDIASFRDAILSALTQSVPLTLEALEARHQQLVERFNDFSGSVDAPEMWRKLGVADAEGMPALDVESFLSRTSPYRHARAGSSAALDK